MYYDDNIPAEIAARARMAHASVRVTLNLLVIRTHRVEQMRDFYEAIGIQFKTEKHGGGPEHLAGIADGCVFEIYPKGVDEPADRSRLGFVVPDLDAVIDRLKRVGMLPSRQPTTAMTCDPDGRVVELTLAVP